MPLKPPSCLRSFRDSKRISSNAFFSHKQRTIHIAVHSGWCAAQRTVLLVAKIPQDNMLTEVFSSTIFTVICIEFRSEEIVHPASFLTGELVVEATPSGR